MPKHDDPTEIEPRPAVPPAPGARSNLTQLRRDITSGATGDKVPVIDPAATPLGTDDEAAGAPPSPEMIAAVRRHERETAPRRSPLDPTDPGRDSRPAWQFAAAVALLAAVGVLAWWIGTMG